MNIKWNNQKRLGKLRTAQILMIWTKAECTAWPNSGTDIEAPSLERQNFIFCYLPHFKFFLK